MAKETDIHPDLLRMVIEFHQCALDDIYQRRAQQECDMNYGPSEAHKRMVEALSNGALLDSILVSTKSIEESSASLRASNARLLAATADLVASTARMNRETKIMQWATVVIVYFLLVIQWAVALVRMGVIGS